LIRSGEISDFLQRAIEGNDFPSAVYLVGEKGNIAAADAIGHAVAEPKRIEARANTIYDLASLTKPLVTGLLLAKLMENGEIALTDRIEKLLPEFRGRGIEIRDLVTHTSGLPAWKPIYLLEGPEGDDYRSVIRDQRKYAPRENLAAMIGEVLPENERQTKVVYSDLNFLLLTVIIERIRGARLDHLAKVEIVDPLGLRDTFYNPLPELRPRIAANEKGNEFEKQTCIDQGFDVSAHKWRDYQIWGEVHDGNAWFLDGVSGHAGIFSTAYETFRIAQQFLPNFTEILEPQTCDLFRSNMTPGLSEGRSLTFQLAVTRDSAGNELPDEAFGHLGFTGTSLWIDPIKERVFILLTNRTHAHPLPFKNINSVRRGFHDRAVRFLDENLF